MNQAIRAALLLLFTSCVACASAAPLPPRAIELNRDGAAALAQGDLEVAAARLALALEYNPRFTEAWVNLGLVELRRGNFELAQKHLSRARDLNPDLPAPHHALGLLADKRGRDKDAEKHYREALKVDPGFGPARANLGRKLFARGADEEAHEQFLRLVEIDPTFVDAWAGLVETRMRLHRDASADEALARARERFGDVPALMLLVARRMLRDGDFAGAEKVLAPLLDDEDPSRAIATRAWLAVARLGHGDVDGAITAARDALSRDREDAVATFALGAAMLAKGDKAQARALLEQSLTRAPQNESARALLEEAKR